MRSIIAAAVATLFATSSYAQAPETPETTADLRCMVVMVRLGQLNDQRHKAESLIGGFYYLGRVDARDRTIDVQSRTAEELAKMPPDVLLTETTRCETEMQARMKTLSEMGSELNKAPTPAP